MEPKTLSRRISVRSFLSPWFLSVLAVVTIWLPHLRESLWLDELQTAWVIRGSFVQTLLRAFETQGFTPFYYLVLWALKPGMSEIALRVLSVLLTLAAASYLWLLGKRFLSTEANWFAVLVFLCLDDCVETAINARPYCLALLLAIASTYYFVRWADEGKRRHKYLYILTAVLTVYAHFLFGGIVAVHLFYWLVFRKQLRLGFLALCSGLIYLPIGLGPTIPQINSMLEKREVMAIAPMPSYLSLPLAWVPWLALLSFGIAYYGALACSPKTSVETHLVDHQVPKRRELIFLIVWMLFPSTLLFAASFVLGTSMFLPRYFEWAVPATALLFGAGFESIRPARIRALLPAFFVLFSVLSEPTKERFREDWRAATSALNQERSATLDPVLLYSGVIESSRVSWLLDPIKQGQFYCPVIYYKVPWPIYLLPFRFDSAEAEVYWTKNIVPQISGKSGVTLLALDNLSWTGEDGTTRSIMQELENRLKSAGFSPRRKASFGRVWVISFERQVSAEPLAASATL